MKNAQLASLNTHRGTAHAQPIRPPSARNIAAWCTVWRCFEASCRGSHSGASRSAILRRACLYVCIVCWSFVHRQCRLHRVPACGQRQLSQPPGVYIFCICTQFNLHVLHVFLLGAGIDTVFCSRLFWLTYVTRFRHLHFTASEIIQS